MFSLFMLVVTNHLVAQTTFTVTRGTTRQYHIDAKPTITTYNWQVYDDANLTSLTGSGDVSLTSLGTGHEHEIEVTWNTLGTYYLSISVLGTDGCTNKMAYTFNVISNNLPVLADDSNSTIETNPVNETNGSGNLLSNDTDADGDLLSVASVNGDLTGTLSGMFGVLNWNSNGTYNYTPNSELDTLYLGESVADIFTVTVTDGVGGTSNSTLTITINGENQNPLAVNNTNVTTENLTVSEVHGNGDLLANDSDVDGDNLIVSSVEGNATGTVLGLYGKLFWSQDGSYNYTPYPALDSLTTGEVVTEVFSVTVSDGKGGESTSTLTITITGENDAPQLVDDANSTTETNIITDATGTGNLLANDSDPEKQQIIILDFNGLSGSSVTGTYGTLNWNENGSYFYTPNAQMDSLSSGESVDDVFTYTAEDVEGLTASALLTITINGVNSAPLLANDINSTIEKTPVSQAAGSGNLLSNDVDPDGDFLIVSAINGISSNSVFGTYGVLIWSTNGTYTYTPNSGMDTLSVVESVSETFTYTATDNKGGTVNALLKITISGANQAPLAAEDTNSTFESTAVAEINGSGNILANDKDIDGDILSVSTVNGAVALTVAGKFGTLRWSNNGAYNYTPNIGLDSLDAGENVVEIFTVVVTDGNGGTSASSLSITINGLNQNEPPVANADIVAVNEDVKDFLINVLSNDTDPNNNALTVTFVDPPISGGTAVLTGNTVIYNPPANFNGNDYFTYQVCDNGVPSLCDADTVFITVAPVNDAPLASTDLVNAFAGATDVSINVQQNDIDIDKDLMTTSIVSAPTSGGVTTVVNNLIVYNAPKEFVGVDTIIYQVCDNGVPSLCDIDTVFVHVVDQLVAVDDVLAINSGESETTNLLANDSFVSNINFKIIKQPLHGSYVSNANGSLTYTASSNYSGKDTIIYVISNLLASDTAIVVITIHPTITLLTDTYCVDEIPYYSWNVVTNGISLSSVDLTIYNLNNELVESLNNVSLSGSRIWPGSTALGSTALYNVPAILQTINIEIGYVINNSGEILTSVLNVPDCHVNIVDAVWDSITVRGKETIIDVLANDVDPDEGDIDITSLKITGSPLNGSAIVNAGGTISYTPNPGYVGADSLIYQICDNYTNSACDTAIVRINVLQSDQMVANNDHYTAYQNQSKILDVAKNDFDPDGLLDLSSIAILVEPENGAVIVNGDGTVTYQSTSTFVGTDQFEYVICNSGQSKICDTAWVYVVVDENQCIVAANDNASTTVNEAVVINVLNNDYDFENELDSTSLQLSSKLGFTGPAHGTVTINNNGTITYIPNNQFAGADSFVYSICDRGYPQCCATAVVYVNVIDSNIDVVATNDDVITLQNNRVVISVLSNDYDPDGVIDNSSLSIANLPTRGSAQINSTNGTITYVPNNGFYGIDSLTYRVCDNGPIVTCATAVVYINVVENLPPVAVNDAFDAQWGQNEPHTITGNDYDPEGALNLGSVAIRIAPISGGFSVDPNTGIVNYMPDYCSTYLDSFSYVIYDLQGNVSNLAKVIVRISIDPVGDYDMDGIPDVAEDLNLNGNPCDDDSDNDGIANFQDDDDDDDGVLTINEDVVFPNGDPTDDDSDGDGIINYLDEDDDNDCSTTAEEIVGNGGNYLFDLDKDGIPNYLDNDDNGNGILSCDEGEDLDNNGIPDRNEIWNPGTGNDVLTIGLDETIVFNVDQVLANDSSQINPISFQIISNPSNGTIDIDFNNWNITYTPNFDFIGADTFKYVVCDYRGMNCDTAIVTINVTDILLIPELFTPNDDGQNDQLVIMGLNRYSWNKFTVFNRWGSKVYMQENYKSDWDGSSNVGLVVGSHKLPVGTYYYLLEYGDQRRKTGALFLKR